MFMWRAVDREGEVLDVLEQKSRTRLMRSTAEEITAEPSYVPDEIVTDGLRFYSATMKVLGCKHLHRPGRFRKNNRQKIQCHFISRNILRKFRSAGFAEWYAASAAADRNPARQSSTNFAQ